MLRVRAVFECFSTPCIKKQKRELFYNVQLGEQGVERSDKTTHNFLCEWQFLIIKNEINKNKKFKETGK